MTPLRLAVGGMLVGVVLLLAVVYLSWQIPAMLTTGTAR